MGKLTSDMRKSFDRFIQSDVVLNIVRIPTEPIGSLPRQQYLLDAMQKHADGDLSEAELNKQYERAIVDTINLFIKIGSPIIVDGEQSKPSFLTYPLQGMRNLASDGVVIKFASGHTRQLPKLTAGPFKYQVYSGDYVKIGKRYTKQPYKQAVISASAISLIYPQEEIPGYGREQFLDDLVRESVEDIKSCFRSGADRVQIDFTEGRLAIKLDPSKALLRQFVALNNRVIDHFTAEERQHIGIHTCPGGDKDSTHSADIDYKELLPLLFTHNVGNYYIQMASEKDPVKSLKIIRDHIEPGKRYYIGVIDVVNPEVESAQQVCERVVEAAEHIPVEQLGTTDDCGFSPFGDDMSTSRDTAIMKITARIEGTRLAEKKLG